MASYSFKKIETYTDDELNLAIGDTLSYCDEKDLDFYKLLNGIDAYFERRKRKQQKEFQAQAATGPRLQPK